MLSFGGSSSLASGGRVISSTLSYTGTFTPRACVIPHALLEGSEWDELSEY